MAPSVAPPVGFGCLKRDTPLMALHGIGHLFGIEGPPPHLPPGGGSRQKSYGFEPDDGGLVVIEMDASGVNCRAVE